MKSILLAAVLAMAANAASAHDYKAGSIQFEHPWARATPKGATIAGGYMKLVNTGATADRLIGGTNADSEKFEIHEMSMDNGVMKMRPLPNGIEIKPGETVELKPGGYHLMFVGLKHPLEKGKSVKGTLQFEKAGKVDVEYVVEGLGATSTMDHGMGNMDHGSMDHGGMDHGGMKMGH
jgi:copper(I)-binding protein